MRTYTVASAITSGSRAISRTSVSGKSPPVSAAISAEPGAEHEALARDVLRALDHARRRRSARSSSATRPSCPSPAASAPGAAPDRSSPRPRARARRAGPGTTARAPGRRPNENVIVRIDGSASTSTDTSRFPRVWSRSRKKREQASGARAAPSTSASTSPASTRRFLHGPQPITASRAGSPAAGVCSRVSAMRIVWVFLGGGLGSVARFAVGVASCSSASARRSRSGRSP